MRPGFKKNLLKWTKDQVRRYEDVKIRNFNRSWSDGNGFLALVHSFNPILFDYDEMKTESTEKKLQFSFDLANRFHGIEEFMEPEDITDFDRPDEYLTNQKVIMYILQFFKSFKSDFAESLDENVKELRYREEQKLLEEDDTIMLNDPSTERDRKNRLKEVNKLYENDNIPVNLEGRILDRKRHLKILSEVNFLIKEVLRNGATKCSSLEFSTLPKISILLLLLSECYFRLGSFEKSQKLCLTNLRFTDNLDNNQEKGRLVSKIYCVMSLISTSRNLLGEAKEHILKARKSLEDQSNQKLSYFHHTVSYFNYRCRKECLRQNDPDVKERFLFLISGEQRSGGWRRINVVSKGFNDDVDVKICIIFLLL